MVSAEWVRARLRVVGWLVCEHFRLLCDRFVAIYFDFAGA